MMMIVLRLLSLLGLKARWHRHFGPRPLNGVFFQGLKWRDSWTPGPKPLCHRHPTGPHPTGLTWTPAKSDSMKSNFALTQAGERAFEDPGGGSGVDALGTLGAAHVVVLDHAARDRGCAESLVLEQHRQRGQGRRAMALEVGRELAHRLAAWALGAVHVERQ